MPAPAVILFDGVCNLCNSSVQWIIDHDPNHQFRFASLQTSAAQSVLAAANYDQPIPDSVVLIDEAGVHTRSTAAIRIARRLGFPWNILALTLPIPSKLRDAIYNWIARNRYKWFGKTETCRIPTPELAARFLDSKQN